MLASAFLDGRSRVRDRRRLLRSRDHLSTFRDRLPLQIELGILHRCLTVLAPASLGTAKAHRRLASDLLLPRHVVSSPPSVAPPLDLVASRTCCKGEDVSSRGRSGFSSLVRRQFRRGWWFGSHPIIPLSRFSIGGINTAAWRVTPEHALHAGSRRKRASLPVAAAPSGKRHRNYQRRGGLNPSGKSSLRCRAGQSNPGLFVSSWVVAYYAITFRMMRRTRCRPRRLALALSATSCRPVGM